MRKQPSHPHQTSFGIELSSAAMPHRESDDCLIKEADTFTISVPEHVPVFTVTLKRTDVVSLQKRTVIRNPGDAATILREQLKEVDREQLIVMMLDTKLSVIGLNTVSIGILDSSLVHPREVFKPAILANAASIILANP
jgi:DNA repair protein RadC